MTNNLEARVTWLEKMVRLLVDDAEVSRRQAMQLGQSVRCLIKISTNHAMSLALLGAEAFPDIAEAMVGSYARLEQLLDDRSVSAGNDKEDCSAS